MKRAPAGHGAVPVAGVARYGGLALRVQPSRARTRCRLPPRWAARVLASVLAAALAAPVSAALFVVNSDGDGDDGQCDTATGCTLREAIRAANASPGHDQILFFIRPLDGRVKTIRPRSPLPPLIDPAGVVINGLTQGGAQVNTIATGATNARLMVELDGSQAGVPVNGLVVIDGPTTIQGLVINRFVGAGLLLAGGSGHEVVGNFIGTDPSGSTRAGNFSDGITVLTTDTRIGGGIQGRNLISGNGLDGIQVTGESARVTIESNLIGVSATGAPVLGNARAGISVWTPSNRIGGLTSGSGNLVGGNHDVGVVLVTADAQWNVIQSNTIVDNVSHGVQITFDAGNNIVARPGGLPQPSNVILRNGGNGVCVTAGAGTPNTVLPFEVADNVLIPIDFTGGDEDEWGVTPNDPLDADDGPNRLQNFPVLYKAEWDGGGTWIEGEFSGEPHTDLLVSFYAWHACHPSGHGDGRAIAGGHVARTDEQGLSEGRVYVDAAVGDWVSAVAMDFDGNSSEMSACIQVVVAPTATPTPTFDPDAPTATPPPPTATPSATLEPTVTSTPTETAPSVSTPTATPEPEQTETPRPSATPTPIWMAGDANCDGMVTAADVAAVQAQAVGGRAHCGGDVDGDGAVTAGDLRALLLLLFAEPRPLAVPAPA